MAKHCCTGPQEQPEARLSHEEYLAKVRALLRTRYGLEPGDVDSKVVRKAWCGAESVDQFVAWVAEKYDLTEITGGHIRRRAGLVIRSAVRSFRLIH